MTWAIEVAARTLYQEVRGEPLDGQKAVAWVIRNRLESGRWGKSLATVCLWPRQFSAWGNVQDPNFIRSIMLPDNDPTLTALSALMTEVMTADPATDPTGSATHYFADSISPPYWTQDATFCGKFGGQSFYRDVK